MWWEGEVRARGSVRGCSRNQEGGQWSGTNRWEWLWTVLGVETSELVDGVDGLCGPEWW